MFDKDWQKKDCVSREQSVACATGPLQCAVEAEADFADRIAADLLEKEAAEKAVAAAETIRHDTKEKAASASRVSVIKRS